MSTYTRVKKYRKNNTAKRNNARKRNYDKSKMARVCVKRRPSGVRHVPWSQEDEAMVLFSGCYSDSELSQELGRSVQAIQQKRYKLSHE